MRVVIFFCVFICSVVGQEDMKNMPKYDARYDYIDIDVIFGSKRLVMNYVDCLINVKPCTPEGKTLRRLLPEALRTKCVRCTGRQKKIAVSVIKRLKNEYPEQWAKLAGRWDPTGDFTRFFEEYLAKEEFNTISDFGNEIAGSSIPTPPPVTTTLPSIENRFGEEDENESTPPPRTTTRRPILPLNWPTKMPKPTQITWTLIPFTPTTTTAITLIDQIGFKIIRTTELVTDILKNTVRAVVGG